MNLVTQKIFDVFRALKVRRRAFASNGIPKNLKKAAICFSAAFLFSHSSFANEKGLREELCRQSEVVFKLGKDLLKRDQNLLAIQFFSQYAVNGCDSGNQLAARILWAQALYNLGENEEAVEVMKALPGDESVRKSEILRGWYQPELRHLLSTEAQTRFEKWDLWTQNLPQEKAPWVAGSLSAIVPGLGQAYNGNYQSAAFSFVLNALFLSATIETQQKGLYATSLAAGTIFSIVYVGNILGSVQSARAINNQESAETIENEKVRVFPELFSF